MFHNRKKNNPTKGVLLFSSQFQGIGPQCMFYKVELVRGVVDMEILHHSYSVRAFAQQFIAL